MLALHHTKQDAVCLISIVSKNPESYMFHTPNIKLVGRLAEALGLPIIIENTLGEKEEELNDLELAMRKAKQEYNIDTIATGAVASVYQASRIRKLCEKLSLRCINPLWGKNQLAILREVVSEGYKSIIVGVFGLGMEGFLGREINQGFIKDIELARDRFGINPAGEGGEFESLVLDGPIFKRSMKILQKSIKEEGEFSRRLVISRVSLIQKV
jgi:ABC transporter with metal-binding/Fe-S-binding domain ATP-binding protein